jgi:hypothetical protein
VAKGGWFIGARRSSSRERRAIGERDAVSLVLRRGRGVRDALSMEDSPDRECARLSRGPRGTDLGGLRATTRACQEKQRAFTSSEEATGESEAGGISARGGRKCHPVIAGPVAEVRNTP